MRYIVIASSSSGNSVLVMDGGKNYLLDAGVGYRKFKANLEEANIEITSLDGIFLTHEHSDHTGGLLSLWPKYKCPIYMSKIAYKYLGSDIKDLIPPTYFKFIKSYDQITLNDLTIDTFKVSHDASDPMGFKLTSSDNKSLVYITDTGHLDGFKLIENASSYIIEANHEPNVLMLSSRPWPLKQRIMSSEGHLSNNDSAKLFFSLMGDDTKSVMLYHLSKECNNKDLALSAYKLYASLNNINIDNLDINVSDRLHPSKIIEL